MKFSFFFVKKIEKKKLPAPNCQMISFISSLLTFPRMRITFRVFHLVALYGNAIIGFISADLMEKGIKSNFIEKSNFFQKKIFKRFTSTHHRQSSNDLKTISMYSNRSNHHSSASYSYYCHKFSHSTVLIPSFDKWNCLCLKRKIWVSKFRHNFFSQ